MARADYAGRPSVSSGGIVARVQPGSPADRAGIAAGDTIVAADGHALADVLDWQWYSEGDELRLDAEREAVLRSIALTRQSCEPWGIEFEAALFDAVRTCRNACAFCFVTQLPKGLRRSLYLQDDDFRLSFLQGNFVSLTNLSDPDVARIVQQALSPLYFSLHAVSPDVRAPLVCAREDRALERADQLLEGGIDLHVQIVLVPGANDGDELEASLTWLAERDGIASVGIVPLGFTGHQHRFGRSYGRQQDAAAIIDQVGPWHAAMREQHGTGWVYLADEFYLAAKRDLPPADDYDEFPQYENGIGLARTFVDTLEAARGEVDRALEGLAREGATAVAVTGELFAPVLAQVLGVARRLDAGSLPRHSGVRVLPVGNRFLGGNVSVTGLLTAEDIVDSIRADARKVGIARHTESVTYLVPDVILNADGVTLDDVAGAELAERTGERVRLVSSDARGLVDSLSALANPSL